MEIKCKKILVEHKSWVTIHFNQGKFYELDCQSARFCTVIDNFGNHFKFQRNKDENLTMTPHFIENYFDYSSPTLSRNVLIEKCQHYKLRTNT